MEADPVNRGRAQMIVYGILLGIGLTLVLLPVHLMGKQYFQLIRTGAVLAVLVAVLLWILRRPVWKIVAHILLLALSVVVWTNIFYVATGVNLIALQFVMIIMLGAFYMLGSVWGIVYAMLNVVPLVSCIVLNGRSVLHVRATDQEMGEPEFVITLCYNFILIVFLHYHFYKVFTLYIDALQQRREELKDTITDLQASRNALQQRSNLQKRLIAAIAYDIKSPLKFQMIAARGMYQALDAQSRESAGDLKLMYESSFKLYHFTNNLLQYATLFLENGLLVRTSFSLYRLAEEKIAVFKDMITSQFVLENAIDPGLSLYTSKELLSVILHNLLDNAVRFTREGSIRFDASLSGDQLEIVLQDTGSGMDEQLLAWCNAASQQYVPLTYNDVQKGLGLNMVKELLHRIGGQLRVESTINKGTTVRLLLLYETGQ